MIDWKRYGRDDTYKFEVDNYLDKVKEKNFEELFRDLDSDGDVHCDDNDNSNTDDNRDKHSILKEKMVKHFKNATTELEIIYNFCDSFSYSNEGLENDLNSMLRLLSNMQYNFENNDKGEWFI